MTVEEAIALLGERHFWWAVAQGGAYCARMSISCVVRSGAKHSLAYRCAENTANQNASARA